MQYMGSLRITLATFLLVPLVLCWHACGAAEPWSLKLLTNLVEGDWFNQTGQLRTANIFCNPGVIIGSSSTPTARAICNLRGHEFYSDCAADMLMAGRFVGLQQHSAAATDKQQQQEQEQEQEQEQQQQQKQQRQQKQKYPWSTEQNTPWMLADYHIQLDVQQRRANSEKRILAEAQVDLFLCNNPDCDVAGDMLMVDTVTSCTEYLCQKVGASPTNVTSKTGQHNFTLGLIFTTFGNTSLTSLHSTASTITSSHAVNATIHKLGNMWGSDSGAKVQEIHYKASAPVWTDDSESINPLLLQQNIPAVGGVNSMPLSVFARLLGQNLADWSTLKYGVFAARQLAGPDPVHTQLSSTPQCVVIILPQSNRWMNEHGWNTSHADCLGQDIRVMPVYLFGSYFYQAQFLGNRSKTTYFSDGGPLKPFHEGGLPNDMVLQEIRMLVPYSFPLQPAHGTEVYKLAGKYAMSLNCDEKYLYFNKKSLHSMHADACDVQHVKTQQRSGCIKPCERMDAGVELMCGNCSVLEVGTAAIAAYRVDKMSHLQAKLVGLHFMRIWNVAYWPEVNKTGVVEDSAPWCRSSAYGAWGMVGSKVQELIMAEGSNVLADYFAYDGMIRVGLTSSGMQNDSTYQTAWHDSWAYPFESSTIAMSVVLMCHYWDKQGVGYADRRWFGNVSQRIKQLAPTYSVMNLLQVQLLDLEAPPVMDIGPWPDPNPNEAAWSKVAVLGHEDRLRQGIEAVVLDAKRILLQHAAAEIATSDATRTKTGAVLDIVMTLVSSIAMASGCADIAALFLTVLCKCCCLQPNHRVCIYTSKGLTAALVVIGIVLPPVFILTEELSAHELNAKGNTSQIAWTSADTGVGSGPYVVLAACALRLTAQYDHTAFVLVWLNLALACAAALLVCATKTALFKHELLAVYAWLEALVNSGVAATGRAAAKAAAAARQCV
jgi:type II secretory pathway pseudopilin PulG